MRAQLFAAVVFGVVLAGPALADEPEIRWYSIVTEDGSVIGHGSDEIVSKPDGLQIIESQSIEVGDQGDPSPMLPWFTVPRAASITSRVATTLDAGGQTVAISTRSQNGNTWSRNDVMIIGGVAAINRTTPAETRTVYVQLPPGTRFDNGQGLFPAWDSKAAPRLEFDNLNIDAMAVEHVVIEALPPDAAGHIAALRKRFDGHDLRGVSRLLLDDKGRILEMVQPMFGSAGAIIIKATDEKTALAPHPPYRLLPHVMTKSPYRIAPSALRGHIRYRFAYKDGIEFDLPATPEQRVTAEPGFVTLDICEDCGPGLATDAATLADALKATAWLQSDAPELKAIAEPIARLAISDADKMNRLRRKARSVLRRLDFVGHYSALETLSRHAGDCTEAATLLAALGRAAHIPTRVANGLVYSRENYHGVSNAFMPHSWTLAFVDGKWRSFDAALDTFDTTHIALTLGDGDARAISAAGQLAGLLRWETMAEVRPRPAE